MVVKSPPSSGLSRQVRILTAKLAPYIRGLESKYSLKRADSEDLLQDTFLLFATHQPTVKKPLQWLITVLKHECLRRLRLRGPQTVSFDELHEKKVPELSVSPTADLHDQVRFEEVVGGLSPRNQRVLWMRFVAQMSWKEIAAALGCKSSGAKKAVFRAVSAARENVSNSDAQVRTSRSA